MIFVFTEIYNCAKIGRIALESFRKHHPDVTVNVYGTDADFSIVNHINNLVFHHIADDIKNNFRQGHLGTASLWARIIQSRPEEYLVHFDSDVIFRQEALSDILKKIGDGASIVGPIRNYVNNPNNRDDVRSFQDLTQTYFFGFNKNKIRQYEYPLLVRMCQGTFNPHRHPVIDFFDPVMFDIYYNGGEIAFLPQEDFGSCDYNGQRAVGKYTEENRHMDFGNKVAHFSAVGSGMNFYNNGSVNVPQSYVDYAVERYALYCKIFYNETLNVSIDTEKYKAILSVTNWM